MLPFSFVERESIWIIGILSIGVGDAGNLRPDLLYISLQV